MNPASEPRASNAERKSGGTLDKLLADMRSFHLAVSTMKTGRVALLATWMLVISLPAQVHYGEVGDQGTHQDYTDGGSSAGIGSASYDYWISNGPWNAPPASGFGDQSWDNEGAVLLAFNPYTGEVFTEIAQNHQYFNPRGRYDGGGHASLGTAAAFKATGGTYPTAANSPLPAGAISEDTIAFTTELRPNGAGNWVVGMYAQASADGAVLGEFDPGHAGISSYNPHFLSAGEEVGSSGSFDGEDIRVYCGYIGWGGAAWMGQFGGAGERGIGFEIDGYRGWVKINISGDRSGLILKEYYFEGAAISRSPGEYGFSVSSRDGGGTMDFRWNSFAGEGYSIVSTEDLSANPDPETWPTVPGLKDLKATPPMNSHVLPRPPGPQRFFALIAGPAPPLFSDDFESGVGNWTTIINDPSGNTRWELGIPAGSTGPLTGAGGSTNAWSTNIGDYGPGSDIALRSPEIDLGGVQGAELAFDAFRDADGFGDAAVVRFLRIPDRQQLGDDVSLGMESLDNDYTRQRIEVVPEALGENIVIEFNFVSDGSEDAFSGLTIDNVVVEALGKE